MGVGGSTRGPWSAARVTSGDLLVLRRRMSPAIWSSVSCSADMVGLGLFCGSVEGLLVLRRADRWVE